TRSSRPRQLHAIPAPTPADFPSVRCDFKKGTVPLRKEIVSFFGIVSRYRNRDDPDMARIELDRVSLTFRVRQGGRITLKELLVRQMFRRSVNPMIEVRALQEV